MEIYITVYIIGFVFTYAIYVCDFILRWLIGFATYTEYGMQFMPKFHDTDEERAVGYATAILLSLAWPITLSGTIRYLCDTLYGTNGNYSSASFKAYKNIVINALCNKHIRQRQWKYFQNAKKSIRYRNR